MKKKVYGLFVLLISYILGILLGIFSFIQLKTLIPNVLLNIFVADVIVIIFIWMVGMLFKTASVYDPYWSVQTVVIGVILMIANKSITIGSSIYLTCILFWAIRLTYNFIKTFHDLSYIDWRYKMLKEKTKWFYPIVNLLGIHLVPTIIVYVASIPFFIYIIEGFKFNLLSIFGLLIMIGSTLLELKADIDMHEFIKNRTSRSEINRNGIWKNSRHPNYLGEICFWYGVALFIVLPYLNYWYLFIGAILNTMLFLFISIPMAEAHMAKYKENYLEYKKEVRILLPIKKKAK